MSDFPHCVAVSNWTLANEWAERTLGRAAPSPGSPGGTRNSKGVWRRCNGHLYFREIADARACHEAWGQRDANFPHAVLVQPGHLKEALAFARDRLGRRATEKTAGSWYDNKSILLFKEENAAFEVKMHFS